MHRTAVFIVLCAFSLSVCNVDCIGVTPEIAEALQTVIHYYNLTSDMLHRGETLRRYLELSENDLEFLDQRELVAIIEDISKINDILEGTVHSNPDTDLAMRKFEITKKRMDKIFEVMANHYESDMKFMKRSEEYISSLQEVEDELRVVQSKIADCYKVLFDAGIKLAKERFPQIAYLHTQESFRKDLEKRAIQFHKPIEEYFSNDLSALENLFPANQPRQTSQEIQALENALQGLPMDPVSLQVLEGFVAEMNERTKRIAQDLSDLEYSVEQRLEQAMRKSSELEEAKEQMYVRMETMVRRIRLLDYAKKKRIEL